MTGYVAAGDRYQSMVYRRCGRSGLLLPAVSLGLLQNVAALNHLDFSPEEIVAIDRYAVDGDVDLWRGPATS